MESVLRHWMRRNIAFAGPARVARDERAHELWISHGHAASCPVHREASGSPHSLASRPNGVNAQPPEAHLAEPDRLRGGDSVAGPGFSLLAKSAAAGGTLVPYGAYGALDSRSTARSGPRSPAPLSLATSPMRTVSSRRASRSAGSSSLCEPCREPSMSIQPLFTPCCEGDFNNSMQIDALRGADSRTPQS
jgi:hypothetical protein